MALQRKVPKKVTDIFDRYIHDQVRTLHRGEAVDMLMREFDLEKDKAEIMFDTFDKDKNGLMSIWEFHKFYECAGESAHDIVEKFKEMDKDGSGMLEYEEAVEALKSLKTATGRNLEELEIEFFMKTMGVENGIINLGDFTNLLHRLKLYKTPAPKKGMKLKC
ncbi:troponin C [Patella vulgata]|uniref:troponin C n=1 Tax=Patella vulgata TaxID=6465 RepID=UPI00217F3D5A|nr:troponin C [Patella vulgata]